MKNLKYIAPHRRITLFDLIRAEKIDLIKNNIGSFDLKELGPDGEPPIIAVLIQMVESKNPRLKELIDFFIANGADVAQKDMSGTNALTWAVINQDDDLMMKFDDYGLDSFEKNHDGYMAMEYWIDRHTKIKLDTPEMDEMIQLIVEGTGFITERVKSLSPKQ